MFWLADYKNSRKSWKCTNVALCVWTCIFFFKLKSFLVLHSVLDQEDLLSDSDSSYSSSSEEEDDDDDVPCTPEKKTKSSRIFSTPKSSRKSAVHTPAKTLRKTVRFHIKKLFLLFLSQLFKCLMPMYQS